MASSTYWARGFMRSANSASWDASSVRAIPYAGVKTVVKLAVGFAHWVHNEYAERLLVFLSRDGFQTAHHLLGCIRGARAEPKRNSRLN